MTGRGVPLINVRVRIAVRLFGLAFASCAAGCQQEMASQPSLQPLESSAFFADGRASRQLVDGTVPRGRLRADPKLQLGRVAFSDEMTTTPDSDRSVGSNADGDRSSAREPGGVQSHPAFVEEFPLPVDLKMIEHGQNRYRIYCEVCHDPLGTGRGKIVERGYTAPPSFHTEALRNAPVGKLYSVAHDGYGSMPSYGEKIPVRELWAIVAYVRALQLSQHFPERDLTDVMRRERDRQTRDEKAGRGIHGSGLDERSVTREEQ